jgi:hypothetical protein
LLVLLDAQAFCNVAHPVHDAFARTGVHQSHCTHRITVFAQRQSFIEFAQLQLGQLFKLRYQLLVGWVVF